MLTISKNANNNYLAKVVKIDTIKKHPNADRLQIATIDFQPVVVGLDIKAGDVMVFCPLESQLNHDFLSSTNQFAHANLNKIVDDENKGFFDDKGRVKAVRLRGEKSMGYLVPIKMINEWLGKDISLQNSLSEEFDTIDGTLFINKYIVPLRGNLTNRNGKKPMISRIIDGQVHLHTDTENLLKNLDKLNYNDEISITYKVHWTSFWVSNVLTKRKLSVFEKLLKKLGVDISETEHDYIYGSRKVIKNDGFSHKKEHFYEYDLWGEIKDDIADKIPKGYTVYGECVGHTKGGSYIQQDYDYGCEVGQKKIMVYRVTITNNDGVVHNLSTKDTRDFCERVGLYYVPFFTTCKISDIVNNEVDWKRDFVDILKEKYTEKDCFMCKNKVPEEWIVIRKESQFNFEVYKLKSFSFLEYESKQLDSEVENIEG